MRLHKFSDVDAFVALDLPGAGAASGPVRWARKVLQGGAKDLARSQTYTYAALQMRRSGASAGISVDAPLRAEAVAAFVAEAAALVPDGTYLPDAAKGVSDQDDSAPLRDGDPRTVARLGALAAAQCDGLSAAVAADAAVGLDGCTSVIEGFSASGPALAEAVSQRGGRVVGLATAEGSLAADDGFDPASLAEAWAEHGDRALSALAGNGLGKPDALWGIGAGVVFAGSRMGIVNHGVVEGLECRALVPSGRLAYTSKALAVCRRTRHRCGARLRRAGRIHRRRLEQSRTPATTSSAAEVASTVAALMADALESDDGAVSGRLLRSRSVPDHLAGRTALRPPPSLLRARRSAIGVFPDSRWLPVL